MNAQHLTTDELADAAEGLLDPARAAFAESHLAGCPDCHAQSDALRAVTATLQAEPPRRMPEAVAHRLNDVVAAQQVQRADASVMGSGLESVASRQRRATLGTFGEDLEKARPRFALGALAAAAVAAVVGFSTYVISASAGLNEPPVVAAVNSRDLGADARALEQASGGLSPHRFSQAWDCARRVTDGRITGLAASSLDGTRALLVYTESDGSTQVTVVTGCGADTPSAGPSALLPR
ncbi:MAG TPA: zf-HC2 domain-containing protein [Propionibacteriaceae bacterium]